jgi:predicted nucleic acid-binding protein
VRLWDANIVRAFAEGRAEGHERVRARTALLGWSEIGLPIVTAAELLDGRLRYVREAHRQASHNLILAFQFLFSTLEFLKLVSVISLDEGALRIYRESHLFPGSMSRNDRLIAAITLAGDHILVTRNVAHFIAVPGLRIENWIDDPL